MPLINPLEQNEYTAALGMDTTSPLMSVPQGYVRDAANCNLGLVSGYIKRDGYSEITTSDWGSNRITLGAEFRKPSGELITVLYGKATGGSTGKLGTVAAGGVSVADLVTGLSDEARPSFVQFEGRLFSYNGADNGILYDGTVTRQIGITAPVAAPTGTPSAGGALFAGNYVFAYTYYNSATQAESSPSPLSLAITAAALDQITLTLVAGSSVTADKIRVWRSVAGGNQLFLDAEIPVASTSHASQISDEELGRPLEIDNSRLSDVTSAKGKFAIVANNRVFLVTGRNEVRYSAKGLEASMPETFQAKAVVSTIGTYGDGDDIVGLGNIGERVIVVKRRSIGILQPIDLPAFNSEVDTQGYYYVEISDSVGGVSHWAGGQVEGEYVFAGRDLVWATNGQTVRRVSDPVQATIRALGWTPSQVSAVSFGNDLKHRRIYLQVFLESDDTVPKITLVGDYQQYPNFRWTYYRPGTDEAVHPGIKAGCFINVTNSIDGSPDVWFGNAAANGKIYKMNVAGNDDGAAIDFKLVTRPLDLGNPNILKLYKKFYSQVAGDGGDYSLTMAPLYNMSLEEGEPEIIALEGAGGSYDDIAEYDSGLYVDDSSVQATYPGHRKARLIQMAFEQASANAPLTIFGWSSTGSGFPF